MKINSGVWIIFVAVGLSFLEKLSPNAIYSLFAYPAAYGASLFFGSHPVLNADGQIFIPLTHHAINVILACSGFGFFCLLSALIAVGMFQRLDRRKRLWAVIWAMPFAYSIAILTNGCRIVCAERVNVIGKFLLPANFQPALHQGVGIILFLTVLMAVSLIRRFSGAVEEIKTFYELVEENKQKEYLEDLKTAEKIYFLGFGYYS